MPNAVHQNQRQRPGMAHSPLSRKSYSPTGDNPLVPCIVTTSSEYARGRQQSGCFSSAVTELHADAIHNGHLRPRGQKPGKRSVLCWFPWERQGKVCDAHKEKTATAETSQVSGPPALIGLLGGDTEVFFF